MELTLCRRYKGPEYTIGTLSIDGVVFCDTLEDTDRGLTEKMDIDQLARLKVYGKTAIPTGRYRIDMDTVSPKFRLRAWAIPFGGKLPRLIGVPCYSGVLIHVGNTADDTLGCILVGENKVKGKVIRSADTFYRLMRQYLLPALARQEDIFISVKQ